jgi:hypothetical protein
VNELKLPLSKELDGVKRRFENERAQVN